jgi:hypothetical protein
MRGLKTCVVDFDIGLRNLDIHLGVEVRFHFILMLMLFGFNQNRSNSLLQTISGAHHTQTKLINRSVESSLTSYMSSTKNAHYHKPSYQTKRHHLSLCWQLLKHATKIH